MRATTGMMTEPDITTLIQDPCWLAHRYDQQRDEIHFVWLTREMHRTTAFLTNKQISTDTPRRAVPRALLAAHHQPQAPLHMILHSGLAGSTLLTHALDRKGVAMTLSEPPILTDVMTYRLSGASPAQVHALLDDVLSLLARPFGRDEAVIVKMGSVANLLGGDILARRPSSRALCLHAPLPIYLALIVRKGLWGRIWGRKLFATLRSARATNLGFTDAEFFEHTDMQIAADAWLILHRVMAAALMQFNGRATVVGSEDLLAVPDRALTAIAGHFGLTLDVDALLSDPLFGRHAKTGEPYDRERRALELRDAGQAHREEIDTVVAWARKVADTQRIPWDLPGASDLGPI